MAGILSEYETDGMGKCKCQCGKWLKIAEVKKDGPNYGKKFISCKGYPRAQPDDCGVFQFLDVERSAKKGGFYKKVGDSHAPSSAPPAVNAVAALAEEVKRLQDRLDAQEAQINLLTGIVKGLQGGPAPVYRETGVKKKAAKRERADAADHSDDSNERYSKQ
jgi:hypothetical protein